MPLKEVVALPSLAEVSFSLQALIFFSPPDDDGSC